MSEMKVTELGMLAPGRAGDDSGITEDGFATRTEDGLLDCDGVCGRRYKPTQLTPMYVEVFDDCSFGDDPDDGSPSLMCQDCIRDQTGRRRILHTFQNWLIGELVQDSEIILTPYGHVIVAKDSNGRQIVVGNSDGISFARDGQPVLFNTDNVIYISTDEDGNRIYPRMVAK